MFKLNKRDFVGIDPSKIISTPRKRTRPISTAFEELAAGNYLEFLNHFIIARELKPAYAALGNFGHGHSKQTLIDLWHAYWDGVLEINSVAPIEGKCCACRRTRVLTYELVVYDTTTTNADDSDGGKRGGNNDDSAVKTVCLMGPDCFNIKFQPLLNLVVACKELADTTNDTTNTTDTATFDSEVALDTIKAHISEIMQADIKMRDVYKNKK